MAIVERVPTPRIDLQEAFRPQAEITDTYVRPPTPAKSPLWDLAEGLSAFSSSLKGLMNKRTAESDANAAALGEATFIKNNSVGYAEAVRTGKLPSFQSPEFVSGYKKAEGRRLGAGLVSAFELDYSTWEGRNSQDPAAFDQFLSNFLATNLPSDDPDILDGALPYIRQIQERGYTLNTQERADGLYNGSLDAHVAGSDEDIDMAVMAGNASGAGVDKETLWEAIIANREAALSTGIRDEDYDKKLIDLVIFKAQEKGEEDLLTLLDNKVPGTNYTYAETQYGREQKAAAAAGIDVAKRQAEERAAKAETAADEAMKDQLEAYAVEKLAADPNFVFSEEFLVEYQKYDPQARINVRDWSKKLAEGIPEDDEEVLQLYDRVLKGEDPGAVVRLGMDAGIIRTPETLKGILGFKKPVADVSRFTNNSVYKTSLGSLRSAATTHDPAQNWFDPEAVSPQAVAVQLDFEKAMTAYLVANPNATDLDISSEAARVYSILKPAISESGGYATPLAAGVDTNPLVPSEQDLKDKAKADDAYKASAKGQAAEWGGDVAPSLDQLPPDERKAIEEAAGAMGIDPEILKERIHQKVLDQLDAADGVGQQVEDQMSGIIDNGTSNYGEDAVPQGDPNAEPAPGLSGNPRPENSSDPAVVTVAPVLNLLGISEGTDKGDGYNETLAYGMLTDGEAGGKRLDLDLTKMSLRQVRALQRKMLKDPDNRWNSSAVGRYQIVGKTLAGLMREMGLSGDELFTPELQDRMALELLKMRGLDQWMAGEISTKRFVANIAKEWASLPKADGTKTYLNQGLGTDAATLIAALHSIRGA